MKILINAILRGTLSLIRYREHRRFSRLRICILRCLGAKIGERVVIKAGVIFEYPENLSIGNNVSIQQSCFISAYAPVVIGDHVSLGHGVSIVTTTHPYDLAGIIRDNQLTSRAVYIKNNVWVGMKSSILLGVTIEEGVVVGAHALVNKNVSKNCVVGGVPARTLKSRF